MKKKSFLTIFNKKYIHQNSPILFIFILCIKYLSDYNFYICKFYDTFVAARRKDEY